MQLTIEHAIAAGDKAATACLDKTHRADPQFAEKAQAAMLAHLRAVGQCSGEVLVDVAIAHGARPQDTRAFGPVFKSMLRRGLIRVVGYCARSKGHGCSGGRLYALVH